MLAATCAVVLHVVVWVALAHRHRFAGASGRNFAAMPLPASPAGWAPPTHPNAHRVTRSGACFHWSVHQSMPVSCLLTTVSAALCHEPNGAQAHRNACIAVWHTPATVALVQVADMLQRVADKSPSVPLVLLNPSAAHPHHQGKRTMPLMSPQCCTVTAMTSNCSLNATPCQERISARTHL